MSELRQPQFHNEIGQDNEKSIPVLVGPNLEAHNFSSMEDLEAFIPDEDIKKALMRWPDSWADVFSGKMGHVFGTHADTMRFLEEERRDWEEWDCISNVPGST